jgi:four helix bundle protein
MKIERFEDIQAWQVARELTRLVYSLSNNGGFKRDFGLRDQIRRAAVSVMANIAEGFDAATDTEFRRFLSYAKRSATEVQSHGYVARDQGYISPAEFEQVYAQASDAKGLIGGFARYLLGNPRRGPGNRDTRSSKTDSGL